MSCDCLPLVTCGLIKLVYNFDEIFDSKSMRKCGYIWVLLHWNIVSPLICMSGVHIWKKSSNPQLYIKQLYPWPLFGSVITLWNNHILNCQNMSSPLWVLMNKYQKLNTVMKYWQAQITHHYLLFPLGRDAEKTSGILFIPPLGTHGMVRVGWLCCLTIFLLLISLTLRNLCFLK